MSADDDVQTQLAEWESLAGCTLAEALAAGTRRALAGEPYALHELVEQHEITIAKLLAALDRAAASRNLWRDRALVLVGVPQPAAFELCDHPRLVPRLPCAACAPRYAAYAAEQAAGR